MTGERHELLILRKVGYCNYTDICDFCQCICKEFCLTGREYPSKMDTKSDLQSSRDAQKTYNT